MTSVNELLKTLKASQLSSHWKRAAVDDNRKSFEENFFSLIDALSKENFPNIKQYDLGFQLVDKEKDNSKAFGVRAYRLKTLVFVPFFYNNGQIFGYELLYLPKLNLFVPNIPVWISYLKTSNKETFGTADESLRELYGPNFPNLLPLRRPLIMKTGKMLKAANEVYEETKFLVPQFISSPKVAFALVTIIDKFPFLAKKVAKFYGTPIIKRAIENSKALQYLSAPRFAVPIERQEKAEKLQVLTSLDNEISRLSLSTKEREILNKQGYLIKDARDKNEISLAVPKVKYTAFSQVSKPGLYDLLMDDYTTKKFLVIQCTDSPKHFIYISLPYREGEVYSARFDDLSNINLNPYYTKHYSDAEFLRALEQLPVFNREKANTLLYETSSVNRTPKGKKAVDAVYIVDKEGRAIGYTNTRSYHLYPGKQIKIFTMARFGVPQQVYLPRDAKVVVTWWPQTLFSFGNPLSLAEELNRISEPIKVSSLNDNTFAINNLKTGEADTFSKLGALVHLVKTFGLTEKGAKGILRKTEVVGTTEWYIKQAEPEFPQFKLNREENPGITFPERPVGQFAPGYPAQLGYENEIWVPGLKRPQPIVNIMEPPPEKVLNTIKRLADINDGEVFDLNLITTLLHTADSYAEIEKAIPKLLKGLDAIGRILFNAYRNADELKEHYGGEDYKKIIDELKTNFENLGELIIDLAQKDIDPFVKELSITETEKDIGE